jgi:Predicted membrane protein
MVPVLELRFAIPWGVVHGLTHLEAAGLAFIGNCIPVPFIILFVRRVFAFMKRISPKLGRFAERMEDRASRKGDGFRRGLLFGLFVFVAIPLPGTGAWTGALIAAMLKMRIRSAFPAIAAGVAVAAVLVTGITYGFSNLIG